MGSVASAQQQNKHQTFTPQIPAIMKFIALFALVAFASARPEGFSSEETYVKEYSFITPNAEGEYSLVLETSDGTRLENSGDDSGPDGAVETQGTVRFIHPDGEEFVLKYVANAEGAYQPESSALPVAPAFPHPIPQHALDQIEKAAREDALRSSEEQ